MLNFEGKLALIIEDDDSSIAVLKKMLEQMKVTVEVIHDSFEVDQQLQRVTRPDVIFLDLEMPHVNGYTVLEVIRNHATTKASSVIAYTTHTSHLNNAKQAGFDGMLGKPLDSRQFPEQFARILEGKAVWEIPG